MCRACRLIHFRKTGAGVDEKNRLFVYSETLGGLGDADWDIRHLTSKICRSRGGTGLVPAHLGTGDHGVSAEGP